jgi:multiple sugar transport system substrate-binding protein/sn-glycerol 3-phosphate transport system substrate-binding protein
MNLYGASVSIPATTPEEELAAWLFVKYYTSVEVQAEWAVASNYFPVRASVAEGLAEYFTTNPAFKTAFDLLQFTKAEPPVPGYDFARTAIEEAMVTIVDDATVDVAATLAAVNEQANADLADLLAQ